MKPARISLWLAAVILLAGCQWLGLAQPDTFSQRLAVGYSTVTSVRASAEALLIVGQITVDDAENIQAQADNARAGLDIARQVGALDPASGDARLTAVLVGLNALTAYLESKQ